jgi:hypothetical protein
MNKRQQRTLDAIFASPRTATTPRKDIEALFSAVGAELTEREGWRLRVTLNGVRATFHRPHPGNEAGRLTIRDARDFLRNAGVKP